MSWGRRLQLAAIALLLIAYSVLSHYGASHRQARGVATLLALLPVIALTVLLAWRALGALVTLAGMLLLAALLWQFWPRLLDNFALLYLLQQFGCYALLAVTFGVTLMRGRTPLCTQLADKVHGPLSSAELRYTRQVTGAWALFFLLNLLATVLLYEFAALDVWSMYANFVAPPLMALMFVGEYVVRRRVLPQVNSGGILATLRVYFLKPRWP